MRGAAGLVGAAVVAACAGWAAGDVSRGVLTADVSIAAPGLFGGDAFAAVINPDAVDIYPGGIGPVNDSGVLFGPVDEPYAFAFEGLPVYAIVDGAGGPVSYGAPLFAPDGQGGQDLGAPLFALSFVGSLSLTLEHTGGGEYGVVQGVFTLAGGGAIGVEGSIAFDLPPWGEPNFLWYGVGWTAIDLFGPGLAIVSNDEAWGGNGWPGATLDKNFFPIPAPAVPAAVGLGVLLANGRRRGGG
jgi:hypothetical protein